MREIKFRGQRTDTKEWVYGFHYIELKGIRRFHRILTDNKERDGLLAEKQFVYEVIPKSVGQFIGLNDKNGKEIYEGNQVKGSFWSDNNTHFKGKGIVEYDECKCCFVLVSNGAHFPLMFFIEGLEIIDKLL